MQTRSGNRRKAEREKRGGRVLSTVEKKGVGGGGKGHTAQKKVLADKHCHLKGAPASKAGKLKN